MTKINKKEGITLFLNCYFIDIKYFQYFCLLIPDKQAL
jgi:hypothetical protein